MVAVVSSDARSSVASAPTVSYHRPRVARIVTRTGLDTRGGENVTIHGTNLSANASQLVVSYGQFTAKGCAFIVPHYEARCTTVGGAGRDHPWRVRVGGQAAAAAASSTRFASCVHRTAGRIAPPP